MGVIFGDRARILEAAREARSVWNSLACLHRDLAAERPAAAEDCARLMDQADCLARLIERAANRHYKLDGHPRARREKKGGRD